MRSAGLCVTLIIGMLGLSSLAHAEDPKPDAILTLTQTSVALVVGYTWGSGTLSYEGKIHRVEVDGFSVLALGVAQAQATGEVFNLKKVEDFNGTYMAASAELTLAAGAGATTMRNQNGVVINLFTSTKGLNVKVAPEGMTLTIK